VLNRARAAGVGRFVTIGTTRTEFEKVRAIAESYEDVYCSFGVHPHEAEKAGEEVTAEEIVRLCDHPKVVGIGETGLDYFYDRTRRATRKRETFVSISAPAS
jgi:TatD DNase family protein